MELFHEDEKEGHDESNRRFSQICEYTFRYTQELHSVNNASQMEFLVYCIAITVYKKIYDEKFISFIPTRAHFKNTDSH